MSKIIDDLRGRMAKVGKLMWDEGLTGKKSIYLAGGNISARIPDTDSILIKPTGGSFGSLKAEDFIVIDMNGRVLKGDFKPSSETPMHTAVYRSRHDVGGIVHFHSLYCGVFGIAGIELIPLTYGGGPGVQFMRGVPIVPWVRAGTNELGEVVATALQDRSILLLEFHGAISVGPTIEQAYHVASKAEELAEFQWHVMCIGKPNMIPESARLAMVEAARKKGEFV
ncbi:MAG: L-fuculose-phosphate aldolase [Thermoproteota archaeon]|nr:L-fuculose-phosphate aldolase [Thermoproteota archaeon]